MALGAVLAGSAADRFGRKAIFAATLVIYSVATGLCGLAWNFESLLVFRFLVGFWSRGATACCGNFGHRICSADRSRTIYCSLGKLLGIRVACCCSYCLCDYSSLWLECCF